MTLIREFIVVPTHSDVTVSPWLLIFLLCCCWYITVFVLSFWEQINLTYCLSYFCPSLTTLLYCIISCRVPSLFEIELYD